ncbi:hypothetical protein CDL15_Pgr025919 [Punica granatum]|uniref:Putative zinc-finger domain-containing protein n=1 Tax=Punica granatum TaxID=22663 RepID=A0A218WCK4_PUNGR|nr:hypothetical protein CDL15_Pgr025919 [Punica granatum]
MERTAELSSLPAMASPPPNPTGNPSPEVVPGPPLAREEGELSSDADQVLPSHPLTVASSNFSLVSFPLVDMAAIYCCLTHHLSATVKAVWGNNPLSSVSIPVQASVQQKSDKISLTNQLPPKNVAARITAPKDNNNLVISFSDDESSSSDDNGENKQFKNEGRIGATHGIRKPSTLTTERPKKYGKVARNVNQTMAKRPSLSRTFLPSLVKNQGANRRADDLRSNIVNKRMEGLDLGIDYGIGSKNLKLQDLRHQIALRESELKLRSAQLNRQPTSGARQESEALNSSKDSVRKLKSADVAEIGAKVPPSKRLKVGPSSYARQSVERPVARSVSPPKASMLERSKAGRVDRVQKQKAPSAGMTESSTVRSKRQDSERVVVASRGPDESKQDGTKNGGAGQLDHPGRMADPAPVSNRIIPADTMAPNVFTKNAGNPLTASLWSSLDNANASKQGNRDIHSLIEIEESLDKQLADAQEHRRMCELEERNALKAYRKAQRALLGANARCAQLYQQRELYSSRLRSCIMDDSGLLGYSGGHDYFGIQMKSSNDMSENVDLIPSISHQMQFEDDQLNQPAYASNRQCANGLMDSYQPMNGQNMGSEPCSEPDGSTSEPLPHRDNNRIPGESSPSNEQIISADENEENFPFDSRQPKHRYRMGRGKSAERQTGILCESGRKMSNNNPQESLQLEATLRSELFARLGARARNSRGSDFNMRPVYEKVSQSDVGNVKFDGTKRSGPLSEVDRIQHSDFDGNDEGGFDDALAVEVEKTSLDQSASHDGQDIRCTLREGQYVASAISLSTFSLRSAFHHVKIVTPLRIESHRQNDESDVNTNGADSVDIGPIEWITHTSNSPSKDATDMCEREASSYSCDLAVDPFWPLCMFELRGRCNDEECTWQHVKDYSVGKMSRNVHDESNGNDQQMTLSYKIMMAALRSLDAGAVSHPTSGIEIVEWFVQFLLNELNQASVDNDQSLETAVLLFNQETDKVEGKKKALAVLSRALEASPTSVLLWIAYLVFYCSKIKPAGKDDMYSFAVKQNQGSYELWLVFINSRTKLNDRFAAYEEALSALHNHSSASDGQMICASSCILDLFLQMIDCYCMSGYTNTAIQIIYDLLPLVEKSNERFNTLLSNILSSCLTISDKCIFWMCCVYLVIYRKLPDAIVQRFECDKDVLSIEWPPAHLTDEMRGKVTELMEFAVSNFESCISNEPNKHVKLAQDFALSHIRCKAALDGLESSRELLDRYANMYPTCLDLALMSARVENYDFEGLSFHGFENALSKWPRGVDGFQCIWNQYAEYALESGKADFAKELMDRWFSAVWKLRCPEPDVDQIDVPNSCDSFVNPPSDSNFGVSAADSYQLDEVYGFLNLSLHKLLQNQHQEAYEAINRALKAANHRNYGRCLKEHAVFMLTDASLRKDCSHICGIVRLLNGYLNDSRASHVKEPLSRKFIEDVNKPRVQQLMRNILCPVSTNFFLVNSVLDSLFGSSLLPQKFGKESDLVDFVEALLEISPSNYQLAISLCKQIIGGDYEFEASGVAASTSISFWAGSVLVSTLSHAVPIAPEFVWVEAANLLGSITGFGAISKGFYKKALSVYPFSIKLWKSYYLSARSTGDGHPVLEAAKEKGIDLDQT